MAEILQTVNGYALYQLEEGIPVLRGFAVDDVREAPDRPGKELVFVARA